MVMRLFTLPNSHDTSSGNTQTLKDFLGCGITLYSATLNIDENFYFTNFLKSTLEV